MGFVEIPDQADADAVLIVVAVGGLAVGAVLLPGPAEPDLDLPIGGVAAVADHEVVAESLPAPSLVPFIEPLGAAFV